MVSETVVCNVPHHWPSGKGWQLPSNIWWELQRDQAEGQSLTLPLVSPLCCVEEKCPEHVSTWGSLGGDRASLKEEMCTGIGVGCFIVPGESAFLVPTMAGVM